MGKIFYTLKSPGFYRSMVSRLVWMDGVGNNKGMSTERRPWRAARKQLLILLAGAVSLYVIVPQLGGFRHGLAVLPKAHWQHILLACLLAGLSYAAAAATYMFLALRKLNYATTVLVQLAGMFVNRLLPAGIGALGVSYAYLRKMGHDSAQAASVVAANNLLGFIGHSLLAAILLTAYHDKLPALRLERIHNTRFIAVVTVVVLAAWLFFYARYHERLSKATRSFLSNLLAYQHRPLRLAGALLSSMALTLCNVLGLWLCLLAVHGSLPFVAVLLVFSFGIALGTATPTPGGLGGVEAGMVAGLLVYRVDSGQALAAVLLYRLVSYWLPLLAGVIAFAVSQRRDYF